MSNQRNEGQPQNVRPTSAALALYLQNIQTLCKRCGYICPVSDKLGVAPVCDGTVAQVHIVTRKGNGIEMKSHGDTYTAVCALEYALARMLFVAKAPGVTFATLAEEVKNNLNAIYADRAEQWEQEGTSHENR